tara:strand:+ start:1086 stop:2645 length:1560 start_codon:yes stop_codon:yes gene_type:complete
MTNTDYTNTLLTARNNSPAPEQIQQNYPIPMLFPIILATTCQLASPTGTTSRVQMHQRQAIHLQNGAEILAFDHQSQSLFVIGAGGLTVLNLNPAFRNPLSIRVDQWEGNIPSWEPTSIAIDPRNRGFAAISWIPSPKDQQHGIVTIFDTQTHQVITKLDAGYHPDCIAFSPDGSKLVIANECEPDATDLQGGITIFNLESVTQSSDFQSAPVTGASINFQKPFLSDNADLSTLRISASQQATPWIDIEPEYLAVSNDGVWVSLQENNALARFDFETRIWSSFIPLGSSNAPFDPSDDQTIQIEDQSPIRMLHQPDTIALFESGNTSYILLANEGEQGDSDSIRFHEAIKEGLIDPQVAQSTINLSNANLVISTIDGDTDHDGDIDQPTALGSRSISIHEATTGKQIWNSGSQIELITGMLFPDLYNDADSRSDQSGPEPEGLAIGYIDGKTLGFVGLERTHAILMYDLTNPSAPQFLDAAPLDPSCRPEGLKFIQIDGRSFLAVAAEKCEELILFEIR